MIPLRDENPTRRKPLVTLTFITANVLIFLAELFLDAQGALNEFIIGWGVIPVELLDDFLTEWPTLFSSMFLHGGWAHLLGNMLYLWVFGDNLEDHLGHIPFILFYLFTGLLATATQIAINPDSTVPNIGASGAIAGVLGAYLFLFPRARILTIVFRFVTHVPAMIVLGFWFVYQFFFGIASLSEMDMQVGGVAFFAHLGGFVAGLLLIMLLERGLVRDDGLGRFRRKRAGDEDSWNF